MAAVHDGSWYLSREGPTMTAPIYPIPRGDRNEEFRSEFLRHHGFEMPGVDYDREVDPL